MNQDRVVVIPARGGSKGVPLKNLRTVGGRTLVERAVQAASQAASLVVVSSDNLEILREAEKFGAVALVRPAELAGDEASSESAVMHAIEQLNISEDATVGLVQATFPFLDPKELLEGFRIVDELEADCAFGAIESDSFLWEIRDGSWCPLGHPSNSRPRRQERQPQAVETGSFYVFKAAGFGKSNYRFHGSVRPVFGDPRWAVDIDDESDLALANKLEAEYGSRPAKFVLGNVDYVFYDFDGVHTDNKGWISESGEESVVVSRADGLGVSLIAGLEIKQMIVSSERNVVVQRRAQKLGVPAMLGVKDKGAAVRAVLKEANVDKSRSLFVGNDLNDLAVKGSVGKIVAVADAHEDFLEAADLVLGCRGGNGAIRELADWLASGHGRLYE